MGKSYIYDYKGNVSQVSNTVGSTFGVEYSGISPYNGLNISDCHDLCREEEGSGSSYPRNACECSNKVFYAEKELGNDCNLSRILYYYHPDYLGHNEYITDITGRPYQYFHYSAFGESLIEKNTNYGQFSSPYRFNGKELDPETGNYYYGARYYNPVWGIWLGVDPLPGNNPHLTPYNFVSNNPIMRIDPNGLDDGWVKGEDGTVYWDECADNQKTTKLGETFLSMDKHDPKVENAISADIANKGLDQFLSYYENEELGEDYFLELARCYPHNASGGLGNLLNSRQDLADAFHISEWTHTKIADGSDRNNTLEHFIGTFLISAKYGTGAAEYVGLANEMRGLLINDRQNGNIIRALTGQAGTAFEWKDLQHNYQALLYFKGWARNTGYYKTHTWKYNHQGVPYYYKK